MKKFRMTVSLIKWILSNGPADRAVIALDTANGRRLRNSKSEVRTRNNADGRTTAPSIIVNRLIDNLIVTSPVNNDNYSANDIHHRAPF